MGNLWGSPGHLNHISQALRSKHPGEDLSILVPKTNSGNFTYDGIEVGGERVTKEIEDEIERLEKEGKNITKFSVVGYSLGGLIARYAIGLLYSKGLFDRISPINFTTFATPHLGVRTPLLGWGNTIFNELGARTLSTSGHQLFTIDTFRDTKKPLLAVLADPSTIFMRALSSFKNPSLYANIVNDRSVPYYTASFSSTDPFTRLDDVRLNYIPDYDDVILDCDNPATPRKEPATYYEAMSSGARTALSKTPFVLAATLILPIGLTFFLANSGYQAFSSAKRIRAHEEGKSGVDASSYRMSLWMEGAQQRMGHMLEDIGASRGQDHLPAGETSPLPTATGHDGDDKSATLQNGAPNPINGDAKAPNGHTNAPNRTANGHATSPTTSPNTETALVKAPTHPDFPTLALTADQFSMIDSLNRVGFQKYRVHIKKAQHSHAAIVVRINRSSFAEGHVVSRHWVERFEF
ncbi:MAG: hypothetical protein M1828_001906 [Chrysothrix sp. TS-e1954]|nr:MAG: hypothetical protein M1828_001906 [Chrysothrix sp. TS-e1954]